MKQKQMTVVMVVLWVLSMSMSMMRMAEGGCPSTAQLSSACAKYVLGSNPPVPSPSSTCCSLLNTNSASCLCAALPASARSLINPKGLANVRSQCKITFSC